MRIAFSIIVFGGLLALIIEVINPHSFLETTGAFFRVFIIGIAIAIWFYKTRKSHPGLFLPGLIALIILGGSYLLYGFSSLCGNLYYEETEHNKNVEKPYSCPRILKDFLF